MDFTQNAHAKLKFWINNVVDAHTSWPKILKGFMRDWHPHSLWICLFVTLRNRILPRQELYCGVLAPASAAWRRCANTCKMYKISLRAHTPRQIHMTKLGKSSFTDLFITTVTLWSRETWLYRLYDGNAFVGKFLLQYCPWNPS